MHTPPTPWTMGYGDSTGRGFFRDATGEIVGFVEMPRAMAELILAAVNGREQMREALGAASGYLLNAKIDLETGAPKRTAIATIEGGLTLVRAALQTGRS